MNVFFATSSKLAVLLIIFTCFCNKKVFSQHDPINVGDNVVGTLEFQGDVNGYKFCSAANVPIYIKASSEDITFLRIELYDEMGDLIASDLSSIAPKVFEQTTISGEYTILVKSQNGNERGTYFLSLQRTVNPIGATPLICNSATMNALNTVTESKAFTFSVSSETAINLTLSSSDITFIRMELFNPVGQIIASDFSAIAAEIQITLSEAGCYTLLIMSQNSNEMGSFSLAQNVTMGRCFGSCPVNEICDNQKDDDGDGLIDCQDEDCCNFFILPIAEIEGTLEFCEGENSVLTASGGANYTWSTGDNTSSTVVSKAGRYTVTVTNNDGCFDTKSVNIKVNKLPVAMINGDLEFCQGESTTLIANGGTNYAWNTGENSMAINVSSTNTYTVVVTDNNGCTDSESVNVIVHDLPKAVINGDLEFCQGQTSTLTASGGTTYAWSTGANVESINVFASNDYSVTVTDANGCTDSETAMVVVHDLPIATIDGELGFCEGESSALIANGGSSYLWSTGETNPIINVKTANNYSVTITDDNGCSDSESVTVTVYPLPIVDFKLVEDTICIDEPNIQLEGGVPIGGNYSGLGVLNNDFNPSIAGIGTHNLTYTFVDINGCSNSISTKITVIEDCNNVTAIDNVNLDNSIKLFPNPSNGNFVIECKIKEKVKLQLFNIQGQELRTYRSMNDQILVNGISKGVYFVRISGGTFQTTRKIIIQ